VFTGSRGVKVVQECGLSFSLGWTRSGDFVDGHVERRYRRRVARR